MKQWEDFLGSIASEIGSEAMEKWAKPLKVIHFDAGNLYLEAHDSFHLNWFEQHLRPQVRLLLRNNNQRPIKVHISLANAPPPTEKKTWKPVLNLTSDALKASCRFDSYFPGKTNEVHFSLLKAALEKLSYNPIYLQGPEGVGKSHLLMASTFFLNSQNKRCLYVKAGTLTHHIVTAIRSSSMQKLRDHYRKHDVLLIDNIDELADRSATQEELFHTFNALHIAGKQIILAGRKLPSEMEGIEPRLTSRFEWGLLLPFHPLAAPERQQWFSKICEQKKLVLSQEVSSFVLEHLPSIPSLVGALDIFALHKNNICLESAKKWTLPLLEAWEKRLLIPEKIIQATAEHFEIGSSDILGRSQNQECSLPRQIAMYLCRELLKMPYVKIAKTFSRDHSTVMTSIKSIEKKIGEPGSAELSYLHAIKSKLIP